MCEGQRMYCCFKDSTVSILDDRDAEVSVSTVFRKGQLTQMCQSLDTRKV